MAGAAEVEGAGLLVDHQRASDALLQAVRRRVLGLQSAGSSNVVVLLTEKVRPLRPPSPNALDIPLRALQFPSPMSFLLFPWPPRGDCWNRRPPPLRTQDAVKYCPSNLEAALSGAKVVVLVSNPHVSDLEALDSLIGRAFKGVKQ